MRGLRHSRWADFGFTTRGWGLSIVGPALSAVGTLWHYPELAVVGVAATGAVLIAIAFVASTPKIMVSRQIEPDRVTRGDPCQVRLRLARRRRGSIAADLQAVDRCGTAYVMTPLASLGRNRETTATYEVPTSRRGVVDIGPLWIHRTDPLRLVSARSHHGEADRVVVYPKVHPLAGLPRGMTRSLDGLTDNVASGAITFDRLRPYVRGDEMRHVHWRTSARLGELMVREHVEESVPTIVVVLDDRAAAYRDPDAFEEACDAAASLITAAVHADLSPTMVMTVAAHTGPIMDQLAEVTLSVAETAGTRSGIADLARRAGGDTIVLLTGTGPYAGEAVAATSSMGGPRTTVVTVQFAGAGGDAASGEATVAEESAVDRVLRLTVPDAQSFVIAWQRRHSVLSGATA